MAQTDQGLLSSFAFRAGLRLEVNTNQTIGTGDIINQAALISIANKPLQGDLNSSDRYHPIDKCLLRGSL